MTTLIFAGLLGTVGPYQMPIEEKILVYAVFYAPLVLAFICGSVIGSLSNVVIHRLPQNKSIWKPPSHCPSCETRIAWYDNIPIFSWLRLRARCRHCGARISPRYVIVELLSGALYVTVLWVFGYSHLQDIEGLPNLSDLHWTIIPVLAKAYIFTSLLLILSAIDIDIQKLPNRLTFPGMIIGFALAFVVFPEGPMEWRNIPIGYRYLDSFIGWLGGGLALYLIAMISIVLMKKVGMGGGDIKLVAMMGAFLGWKALIVALFIGFLLGAIFSLLLIMMKVASMKSLIPFGPYLAAGGFIAMLYGKRVAYFYYMAGISNEEVDWAELAFFPVVLENLMRLFG